MVAKKTAFDYGADASADDKQQLEDIAAEIKGYSSKINEFNLGIKTNTLAIGRALIRAKALMKEKKLYGKWGPWLKQKFDWTQRTAENYMVAVRLVDENEKFSILKPSAQVALANAPDEAKTAVLEHISKGDIPSVSAVQAIVEQAKDHKDPSRVAARAAQYQKLAEVQQKSDEANEKALAAARQEFEQLQKDLGADLQQVAEILFRCFSYLNADEEEWLNALAAGESPPPPEAAEQSPAAAEQAPAAETEPALAAE